MKALILTLTLLSGFTVVSAQNGEQLSIKNGQQKTTKVGRITIKFLELVEDSRCPADVACVWAGVARIKVQLRKNGRSAEVELNTNQRDKPAVFAGYSIGLETLVPRQTSRSKYSPSAYSATLVIKRV